MKLEPVMVMLESLVVRRGNGGGGVNRLLPTLRRFSEMQKRMNGNISF